MFHDLDKPPKSPRKRKEDRQLLIAVLLVIAAAMIGPHLPAPGYKPQKMPKECEPGGRLQYTIMCPDGLLIGSPPGTK